MPIIEPCHLVGPGVLDREDPHCNVYMISFPELWQPFTGKSGKKVPKHRQLKLPNKQKIYHYEKVYFHRGYTEKFLKNQPDCPTVVVDISVTWIFSEVKHHGSCFTV